MDRREFIIAGGALLVSANAAPGPSKSQPRRFDVRFGNAIADIERGSGGRLGVAVIDTASGERFAHRGNERFPMCSSFKYVLAAVMLKRAAQGRERMSRRLPVRRADIVSTSPFCEQRVGSDASIAELCEATVTVSDNSAANLLLRTIGGPAGFTRLARGLGDPIIRLDRWETAMGEAVPGDPRDTTTPAAMAATAQRLVLGNALAGTGRAQLIAWMQATRTGDNGLPAGLPPGWRIAHKTGTGGHGTDVHVGVLWPPRRAPLVVTSFVTGSTLPSDRNRPLHARVARAVVAQIA